MPPPRPPPGPPPPLSADCYANRRPSFVVDEHTRSASFSRQSFDARASFDGGKCFRLTLRGPSRAQWTRKSAHPLGAAPEKGKRGAQARVSRLESLENIKAAKLTAIEIPEGKVLGESALCKFTKQIEDMRGGYESDRHKTDHSPRLQMSRQSSLQLEADIMSTRSRRTMLTIGSLLSS